jgi:hypothetical protein
MKMDGSESAGLLCGGHPPYRRYPAWNRQKKHMTKRILLSAAILVAMLNSAPAQPDRNLGKMAKARYTALTHQQPTIAPPPERLALWTDQAPIGDGKFAAENAFITVYRPAKPNGAAVVICPGGGYGIALRRAASPQGAVAIPQAAKRRPRAQRLQRPDVGRLAIPIPAMAGGTQIHPPGGRPEGPMTL